MREGEMRDWVHIAETSPVHRRFLRPVWYEAWERAYGAQGNWRRPMRLLLVQDEQGDGCAFPYAIQKIGPFRFASLCGGYFPSRGVPFSGDADSAASQLMVDLRSVKDVAGVRLGPVRDDDVFIAALEQRVRKAGRHYVRKTLGAEFVLANPGGVAAFEASLSKSRVKKIEYYWRKFCGAGQTELRHYHGMGEDWASVMRDVATVEKASWVAQRGEPHFLGTANQDYWATLCQDDWFANALHLWMIYHEGRPVSFALAIDSGQTRYVYANSFDEAVAQHRTGTKIYYEILRDAFAGDIALVNIGMGDSGYKSGWGAVPGAQLLDIVIFQPTIMGNLARWAEKAQHVLAQWRNG